MFEVQAVHFSTWLFHQEYLFSLEDKLSVGMDNGSSKPLYDVH